MLILKKSVQEVINKISLKKIRYNDPCRVSLTIFFDHYLLNEVTCKIHINKRIRYKDLNE